MMFEHEPVPTPRTRSEALSYLGGWAATLGVGAVALTFAMVDLHPPQVWSGADAWNRWASRHDPDAVVAAMVVPASLAMLCTLAVATAAAGAVVALATRRGRTWTCPDRWPTTVASFVAAVTVLAGGPAAASTGSGASAGDEVARRPMVELVGLSDRGPAAVTTSTTSTTAAPEPVPSSAPADPSTTTSVAPAARPAATEPPLPVPPQTVPGEAAVAPQVEVQPGDNLWRIAERQVAADPRQGPTLRYWLRLIDVNRSRFVEPGNPSLIFPGQVLELPGQ